MDYLWSPWRMEYVQSNKIEEGCVFCNEISRNDSVDNLVIYRGHFNFVIINRYPYTSGHLMVVPFAHQNSIEFLTPEIRAEMFELSTRCINVLREAYQPQGFNLGINIGEAAGAGILDHVHLHIVPRWGGDTNFMSSLGQTRVLPEALGETYQRIKKYWYEAE